MTKAAIATTSRTRPASRELETGDRTARGDDTRPATLPELVRTRRRPPKSASSCPAPTLEDDESTAPPTPPPTPASTRAAQGDGMTNQLDNGTVLAHNLKAQAVWNSPGGRYDEISRSISDAIEHAVERLQAGP